MAQLKKENGELLKAPQEIQKQLSELNVNLKYFAPNPAVKETLKKLSLMPLEKEMILEAHNDVFKLLKEEEGYQTQDLIVMYPEIENLNLMLEKFSPCHTHADDEVRYIVDGEGVFGFVKKDGEQLELLVTAGDYINVPKNTEHWFTLTELQQIKAIRYFTTMDGWTPEYTGTQKRI